MAEPRSKRACTVRAQGPSSTHYVGYVEDDETPEAIMKKFEALERVQQRLTAERGAEAAGAEAEEGGAEAAREGEALTEEQLLEVFKQTSVFTLRTMQTHDGAPWPAWAAAPARLRSRSVSRHRPLRRARLRRLRAQRGRVVRTRCAPPPQVWLTRRRQV